MSDSAYSSNLSAEEREAQEAQQQMLEAQALLAAAEAKRMAAEARLAEAKLAAAEAQLAQARKNVEAASQQAPKVWPPAPKRPAAVAPSVPTCPSCGRKLLTMNSALCNWCGAKIDDPEYQMRAADARAARDAEDRARVDAEREEEAKYGFIGSLKRRAKKEP